MKPLKVDQWIIKDVLSKGGFLLFGGTKGIGKSIMVFNLAKDLSTGAKCCWGLEGLEIPKPRTVLYLDYELGEDRIHKRARELFDEAPPEGLHYLTDAEEALDLDSNLGTQHLTNYVNAINPEVVIIDPVSDFMTGSDSDNSDVRDFFKNMKRIRAERNDIAFVLVHHFGKVPQGQYAQDYDALNINNFRGASKWTDSVDTAATVVQEGKMRQGTWKNRIRWVKTRDSTLQDQETVLHIENFKVSFGEKEKGLKKI